MGINARQALYGNHLAEDKWKYLVILDEAHETWSRFTKITATKRGSFAIDNI